VPLVANWPGSDNENDFERLYLVQHGLHDLPSIGGVLPGYFEPAVQGVGQRYLIPEVTDLDGVPRRLEMVSGLIQADNYGGDVYAKLPDQTFVAIERPDITGQYQLKFEGFSISGNELRFDTPMVRWESTTETPEAIIDCIRPVVLTGFIGELHF
jgi:hypothetical protein